MRWGVYLLRKKAERIGSVKARTEKVAMELAVEEFEVREVER